MFHTKKIESEMIERNSVGGWMVISVIDSTFCDLEPIKHIIEFNLKYNNENTNNTNNTTHHNLKINNIYKLHSI